MIRWVLALFVAGLVIPVFSGCSGVATTAGHRYAQMDVKAQWVDGVPEFVGDRPGGDDRSVTVRVRNPSGLDLNTRRLRALLTASIEEDGWKVTSDPDEARYDISAVVKFWGRNEHLPDDSESLGKLLGAAAGGAIAYNQVKDKSRVRKRNTAILGAYVGSAIGDLMDRRTRSEAWTMIIETRIDETVDGTVNKSLDDRSRRGSVAGSGTAAGQGGFVVGADGTRTRRTQEYDATSNKVRIKNTLVITARQVGLQEIDALPAVEERLERIIPEILP